MSGECALEARAWNYEQVPNTLKRIEQWNPCYLAGQLDMKGQAVTTAKRPIGGPKSPFTMKDFATTTGQLNQAQRQHFGFCITPNDDVVCIDVDHLPTPEDETTLPDQIRMLIKTFKTYVEISPSGQGIHIYYTTNKALLAHRKDQDKGTLGFEGSIFLRNQFVTVTGHKHPLSVDDVNPLETATLERVLFAPSKVQTIKSAPDQTGLSRPNFTLSDLEKWLWKIPPNLSASPLQPALRRAYARFTPPITDPDDYQHWMYVAAALHYGAQALSAVAEGEELFVEWSLEGENEGEQNIRQKYHDCAPKHDGEDLTQLTLISLASVNKPVWPYPVIKTPANGEKVVTDTPVTTNVHNWQELFKHYDLSLKRNEISKRLMVSTSADSTKKQYFSPSSGNEGEYGSMPELGSALLYFAQANGMPNTIAAHAKTAADWWAMETTESYNPVKEWLDSAPPLASDDTGWFQALWETIELYPSEKGDEELYRAYMKKNLMGIIRAHYHRGEGGGTTGIVILQGSEAAGKSRWIEALLPPELQDYIVSSQAALKVGSKELSLEAGMAQIWLKDEIEAFMSSSGQAQSASALKSFLTVTHDFYRPLFANDPVKVKRKCIFFGTTNEIKLQMAGTGNRRLQIIPVKSCDATALAKLPLIKVYQELLREFSATPQNDRYKLWHLSEEERDLTNQLNDNSRRTQSALDIILEEMYDFSRPFDIRDYLGKSGTTLDVKKLTKPTHVAAQVHLKAPDTNCSPTALKRALERICGPWSGTIKEKKFIGAWSIEAGWANKVSPTTRKSIASGFPMPPLVSDGLQFEEEIK